MALIFHAWGMALLVGGGLVVSLQAMRVGAGRGLTGFRALVPVMWTGVLLAVPSGLVLLVAYPAKSFTNPVFAIKFTCLAAAALLVRRLLRDGEPPARAVAAWCLLLWLAGVTAGKLLLHTFHVLTVS